MVQAPQTASQTKTLYVIFTAEIMPVTVERLTAVMVQAVKDGVGEAYLAFSTAGGQVQEGIVLYNTLLAMPFNLTVHNIGSVNSIGNVIFLAGARRYATGNATFMFHGVGFNVNSPTRIDEQFARDRLDSLLVDQKRMGQIITSRSKIDEVQIADLFRTQTTLDAPWAKDNGVIEDIKDFAIPPGCPIVSLVFQR